MNKPTESHIEKFVRYPEELSKREINLIEQALHEHEDLKLLADWFALFDKKEMETIDDFNSQKSVPGRIKLTPINSHIQKQKTLFVLAAETSEKKSQIESVKTFLSEEHQTLMRVLFNRETGSINIHIVSEYLEPEDIALLQVPEENLTMVSVPGGKLDIPAGKINKEQVQNWSRCHVKLPLFRSRITRSGSKSEGYIATQTSSGIKSIEMIQKEGEVHFFSDNIVDDNQVNYLVLNSDDRSTIWEVKDGKTVIPGEKIWDKKSVLFFYN